MWLSVTPASGSSTGGHNAHTVTYNTANVGPGTYSGTITITATGASSSPLTIPVRLTVIPTEWSDDFEDGQINTALWAFGGGYCDSADLHYSSWTVEEIAAADGYLHTGIQRQPTGVPGGAYVWLRTKYNFNDGKDHVINFTWGNVCPDSVSYPYNSAVQVTDGEINQPPGSRDWFMTDTSGTKNIYTTIYYVGPEYRSGTKGTMSVLISAWNKTAYRYRWENLTGGLASTTQLDPTKPWYLRFIYSVYKSGGTFSEFDASVNFYLFTSERYQAGVLPSRGKLYR